MTSKQVLAGNSIAYPNPPCEKMNLNWIQETRRKKFQDAKRLAEIYIQTARGDQFYMLFFKTDMCARIQAWKDQSLH